MFVRRVQWVLVLVSTIASIVVSAPAASAAPSNDNFANASVISGTSGSVDGTNVGATGEAGEPETYNGSEPFQSVWYAWEAPETARFVFHVCTADFDTTLAAYTGSELSSLTLLNWDDAGGGCGPELEQSQITVGATTGSTYYISVDGYSTETGSFTLEWKTANDDFDRAEVITGIEGSVEGNNTKFTGEPGEPGNAHFSTASASAWYSWTAPVSDRFTIDTCTGRRVHTTLGVYKGTAVSDLILVRDNDDACGPDDAMSSVTFDAIRTTTYRISVDGWSGPFVLRWGLSNDNFANSEVITGTEGSLFGTTVHFRDEEGEPDNAGVSAPIQSAWYSWTAPESRKFRFSACGTGYYRETTIGVYTGSRVGELTLVADNGNGCKGFTEGAVRFSAESGVTYHFSVDGLDYKTGGFELSWHINNDDFADAIVITGTNGSIDGTTAGFTGEPGEPQNAGNSGPIASAWYRWTAPQTGVYTFDTCSTPLRSTGTTLGVYTGSAVNALTVVAENDDACGTFGDLSRVHLPAQHGETYHISVDGGGWRDLFRLQWKFSNDAFVDAEVLQGSSGLVEGNNEAFTGEPSEPSNAGVSNPIQSAWYEWTAPENGKFAFDTCVSRSSLDTTLGVYAGEAVESLSSVAENDDDACWMDTFRSRVIFTAVRGTTYHISVDSAGNGTGPFILSWDYAPGVADLSVRVTDSRDPLAVGGDMTYTIVVSNSGPSASTTGEILHVLPLGTSFFYGTTSDATCDWPPQRYPYEIRCEVETIQPGESATVKVHVKGSSENHSATAVTTIGSYESDPDLNDRQAETTTFIYESPLSDLSIVKTDSSDPVPVESNVTYKMVISNEGPDAAAGVVVRDVVDEPNGFVSVTTSQGSCPTVPSVGRWGNVECRLGKLPAGKTATVRLTMSPAQSGSIAGFAFVSSNGAEMDNGDLSDFEQTTVTPLNVISNASFELDKNGDKRPDRWTHNSHFTRVCCTFLSGRFAGRHRGNDDSNYTVQQTISNIKDGAFYRGETNVFIPPTTDSFTFRLELRWLSSDNRVLRTDELNTYTSGPTEGWHTSVASLNPPTGARKAQLRMVVQSLNATIYVDKFFLSR